MTNAEYHGDTARISKSGLDLIARSPLHYWQKYLRPDRTAEAPTPALLLGSAIHAAILEPDVYASEYTVAPKFNRRSNAGKAEAAEWEAANEGRQMLSNEDAARIEEMRTAVFANANAARLLAAGKAEGTLHFTHPDTGVKCKARLDWLHSSGRIIVDIKSTEDASPAAFAKSVANYRYHVQSAFYLDAFAYAGITPPERFVFVAVEKTPPYGVALYYLDAEAIEVGRDAYTENLHAYAQALASGNWGGYSPNLEALKLPVWALNK